MPAPLDGAIHPEEQAITKAIGSWMQKMAKEYAAVVMPAGKNRTGVITLKKPEAIK